MDDPSNRSSSKGFFRRGLSIPSNRLLYFTMESVGEGDAHYYFAFFSSAIRSFSTAFFSILDT